MRIISLNAWGGAQFDRLVEWLPQCGAEVVCLQEVTRSPGATGWTRFEDGERSLPQRANLFDDITRVLPRHQAVFVASDAGPVVDDAGRRRTQDFGIAMWIDERLPVIGFGASFVHGHFVDHEEWAIADRPRVAQSARLVDRERGRAMTVTHLHGLRDPAGKGDSATRLAQARRLAALVEQTREPDDLTVVCGDLNVLPASVTFDVLREIGLHDLVGEAPTRTRLYRKPVAHANYLLVSDPSIVKDFRIVNDPIVSDHCPLVIDF